jgi:hypothetical protein
MKKADKALSCPFLKRQPFGSSIQQVGWISGRSAAAPEHLEILDAGERVPCGGSQVWGLPVTMQWTSINDSHVSRWPLLFSSG